MSALRTAGCYRCQLLDDDNHDPYGRTCFICRTVAEQEKQRRDGIEARKAREAYIADRIDGLWNAGPTRAVAAGTAVTLMLSGQAHAATADADATEPFISIAILSAIMIVAFVGMWVPWPWPFVRKSAADPHASPFGDIPSLPEGRRE